MLPKRVKDLPPFEPDSEDDKTLAKSNHGLEIFSDDKLNKILYRPKRTSELSILGSDSEDDETQDNFNRAILNESFIFSPQKDDCCGKGDIDTGYGDSFLINFNKLSTNDAQKKKTNSDGSPSKFPSQKRKPFAYLEKARICSQEIDKAQDENCNPFQPYSQFNNDKNNSHNEITSEIKEKNVSTKKIYQILHQNESQHKKNVIDDTSVKTSINSNCAPPQVSFQVQPLRKPFGLNSTAQKKNVIEFKLQKVLFQTPYAASRPPISSLANNISLDLDDSVKTPTLETAKSEKQNLGNKEKTCENPAKNEKLEVNEQNEEIIINNKPYLILKKLGSGGSSNVFLAKRKDNDQYCALKIVDLRGDQSVVTGYLNETRLLAQLQGNINVVNLYEYEHLSKKYKLYMVMERGDSDLHQILQTYNTSLPLYVLVNYLYQMLQAVNYIHQNGVIHSDLKPANFLMINGRLKLIDFGIASKIAIDSTSIIKFSQAGTFNYISPEALIDTSSDNSPIKSNNQPKIKISTKSDVWSLGCILYLLLYKKTPFGHIKHTLAKVNAITNPKTVIEYPDLPVYYPPMLKDMARKCLVHQPKERMSVADLLKFPFDMIIPLRQNAD